MRLLTNLETATHKLLQIVFLGQPELRDLLRRSDLRQLAQRITARYHLGPLSAAETAAYTRHRLTVAGCTVFPFTAAALRSLHRQSGGVPRLINIIAERSLLAAYAQDRRSIGAATVRQAAAEVLDTRKPAKSSAKPWIAVAALLVAVIGLAYWAVDQPRELPAVANSASTSAADTEPTGAAAMAVAATDRPENGPAPSAVTDPVTVIEDPAPLAINSSKFADAWQSLFRIRGLGDAPATGLGRCALQLSATTYCLEGRGSLFHLQLLGRPVLLHLPALKPGFAVLSLQADQLMWYTDERLQVIENEQLEAIWGGRYWDVWQMPGYVPILMQEGDRGPGVLWVKAAAARSQPAFVRDVDDPYFGPSLKRWVLSFQQQTGLRDDGLIGPETLQLLARFGETYAVAGR